jgi:hypothetical protein
MAYSNYLKSGPMEIDIIKKHKAGKKGKKSSNKGLAKAQQKGESSKSFKYFKCGEPGHYVKNCPSRIVAKTKTSEAVTRESIMTIKQMGEKTRTLTHKALDKHDTKYEIN